MVLLSSDRNLPARSDHADLIVSEHGKCVSTSADPKNTNRTAVPVIRRGASSGCSSDVHGPDTSRPCSPTALSACGSSDSLDELRAARRALVAASGFDHRHRCRRTDGTGIGAMRPTGDLPPGAFRWRCAATTEKSTAARWSCRRSATSRWRAAGTGMRNLCTDSPRPRCRSDRTRWQRDQSPDSSQAVPTIARGQMPQCVARPPTAKQTDRDFPRSPPTE